MDEEVNPLVSGELLSLVDVVLQVNVRYLNRLQILDIPAYFLVLARKITDCNDTPYAVTRKKLRIGCHVLCPDRHSAESKVRKCGLIFIRLFIQDYSDLVDDPVLASFTDGTLYRFRIRTMNVVLLYYVLHLLKAQLYSLLVIACAVLSEKVFQHVGRNRESSLY